MDAALIDRIETNVERAASGLFAAAAGYATYVGMTEFAPQPERSFCAAAAVIIAHLLCSRALNAVARSEPRFEVPDFDFGEMGPADELLLTDADRLSDELVLTDEDRLVAQAPGEDLLLLDDVLAELGPDARVVRLFDRKAMPTPGQLKSRIDNHLGRELPAAQSDASQALSDALDELRRSLR